MSENEFIDESDEEVQEERRRIAKAKADAAKPKRNLSGNTMIVIELDKVFFYL